jgi:hypothetical protein
VRSSRSGLSPRRRRRLAASNNQVHALLGIKCGAIGAFWPEDLFHDIFLEVWRALPGFRGDASSYYGVATGATRFFVACSKAYAISINVGSLHARPVKPTPYG